MNFECPECNSLNTERVSYERYEDVYEEYHICNDCPASWTVEYGDPIIKDIRLNRRE